MPTDTKNREFKSCGSGVYMSETSWKCVQRVFQVFNWTCKDRSEGHLSFQFSISLGVQLPPHDTCLFLFHASRRELSRDKHGRSCKHTYTDCASHTKKGSNTMEKESTRYCSLCKRPKFRNSTIKRVWRAPNIWRTLGGGGAP